MNSIDIQKVIEDNYDIKVKTIEKVKNTYKIHTEEGAFCIKIIKYQYPHFYFIISAINHLQNKGFNKIPLILKTKDGKEYIALGNNYAYLTEWVPSRVSNYDNPIELARVSQKLGELHSYSTGFMINRNMQPRYGWYSWIRTFETRCEEILDFEKRINQKFYKSDFDKIFLENIDKQIQLGIKSIEGLKKNNYFGLMDAEVMKCGFCHHDYAHHNILIDKSNELNIIDFDYCILDSHLHDLSSLLIRAMKDGKWEVSKADLIMDNYKITNKVTADEMKLMKYFIEFPQAFWQIGLQYYWEQQPWGQELFINKITKYLDDVDEREAFIDQYFK